MPNVLFLCTGNSARSIMAEAYLNHAGAPSWRAWSAGSKPTGAPNPFAIETLHRHAVPIGAGPSAPRSKSWDEFAGVRPADAPAFLLAQFSAAALAVGIAAWLFSPRDGGKGARYSETHDEGPKAAL